MIAVVVTQPGAQVKVDFDKVEDMEMGLAAVAGLLLRLSPLSAIADASIAPSQPTQEVAAAVAVSEDVKRKQTERMTQTLARLRAGHPSQTDCMVRSLKEIGKPCTAEEIHDYMVKTPHIDFASTAIYPLHGIKETLRKRTRLFTDIGNRMYVLART